MSYDLDMHRKQLSQFGNSSNKEEGVVKMKKAICYDDVLLVPRYSDIRSRSEINTSNALDEGRDIYFDLPIFAASMDTVTGLDMAWSMNESGCGSIIHRYCTIESQTEIVRRYSKKYRNCMAAVGVAGDYIERARALVESGCKAICIDVAHGHHVLMKEAIKDIRKAVGPDIHIMAGAVATLEGYNDLADWGADSVRCGIGTSGICSTRIQTGFGIPGLETIFECAKSDRTAKIIADGGIKNSGCIVKALAAGADFVILGSLLSGTNESPGEFVVRDGMKYKTYRGMASKEAQIDFKGSYSSYEGISVEVLHKGSAKNIVKDLNRGIRSGFSYCGAKNIKQLRKKAKFIEQTQAGMVESSTYLENRQ